MLPTFLFAQNQEKLTASQIVDSSLVFCGGELQISKINSAQITYLVTEPNDSTEVVHDKLKTGEKYVQCMLSKTYLPQTIFFDGEKISKVDGSSVTQITDIESKEEVKLKTYSLIQYGYKKLNYQLSRLPDHKFENADCFVVEAKAQNGYTTTNFFDKKNYRLIMVIYPNGNKSVLMDYVFKDGILVNSKIGNSFAKSKVKNILKEIQTWDLISVHLNENISDTWFSCPYTDKVFVPEYIKTGRFASTNGDPTTFTRNDISMDYTDDKGNVDLRRFLVWGFLSPDTFGLIDEQAFKNNDKSSASQIFVRVVSWDEYGYVCQWITDKYTDTQDYKLIK
ncbi:hypothetical protein QWZ17_25000 [Mucilaginibacter flavus]|nr:hypothetical protein [Mucilaginibacter flavus]